MNLLKNLLGGSTKSLSAADLKAQIDSKQAPLILDVRQPDEYRAGHITGAKLIPLGDLAGRMNELPKDKEILCVCRSGSRSSVATAQLARAGLNAVNLRGGMNDWERSGYPVKKGGA